MPTKKMGKRTNQKLIRRMHEVLFQHGPMSANELSCKIYDLYPNFKRFHRGSMILSQLMVGRPKMFNSLGVSSTHRCLLWEALPRGEEE